MIVKYSENQYINGELVLLAGNPYKFSFDKVNNKCFVINQNNKIVYLDKVSFVNDVK